tara:strand:- start:24 stop:212 length:189 start_codon:yes stop_codon:yes gene_type:complete
MDNEMNITSAQWFDGPTGGANEIIKATIDGQVMWVPVCVGNKEYDEIMKQVEAGTLTIADAD